MDTYRNHLLEDTREQIVRAVASGFITREQIVDMAMGYLHDDPDNEYPAVVLRRVAERMTNEVLNDHYRQQAAWPYPTDCDRLDEAFDELNRAGIVARQHFKYCRVGATAEIRLDIAQTSGTTGYAFYCEQDTAYAQAEGVLFLSFGSVSETEDSARSVGQRILQILSLVGLQADWNDDLQERIGINLDWKRRRPE